MTTDETEDEELLLSEVVAGERDALDPEVQALLARQPVLRQQLQRLQALDQRIGRAAAREQELMRADLADVQPGEPDADTVLARVWGTGNPRPVLRRSLLMAALLLVGSAVVIALLQLSPPASQHTLGRVLPGEIESSVEADRLVLRWNLSLPEGGRFVLRFYSGDLAGPSVRQIEAGSATQWTFNKLEPDLVNGGIVWEVRMLTKGGGDAGGGGPAPLASLRSR